jgi:hypothetical protein
MIHVHQRQCAGTQARRIQPPRSFRYLAYGCQQDLQLRRWQERLLRSVVDNRIEGCA